MTWFPDPIPSSTDLVYAGSRAPLTASDTLRHGRRGRGANLSVQARGLRMGRLPQVLSINSLYNLPWHFPGNRTY